MVAFNLYRLAHSSPQQVRDRIEKSKAALDKEIEDLLFFSVGVLTIRDEPSYALMHDP